MEQEMNEKILHPEMMVSDVLDRWPEATPVFIKHRMACVGCSMSKFETLAGAAEIYRLPISQFLCELEETLPASQA